MLRLSTLLRLSSKTPKVQIVQYTSSSFSAIEDRIVSKKRVLKSSRKNRKTRFRLTANKLLDAGFQYGGDPSAANKAMQPFVIGQIPAFSMYEFKNENVDEATGGGEEGQGSNIDMADLNRFN